MKTMAITDFKSHALQVLGDVAAHKERVVVTKRGKPLAEVVPYADAKLLPGQLAEALVFDKDVVTPLGQSMWNSC
jgi:prevent-host-death family protein